jgi:hypothetical protein
MRTYVFIPTEETLSLFYVTFQLSLPSRAPCSVSLNADFVIILRIKRCRYSRNADASLFFVNAELPLSANADCFMVIISNCYSS